MEKNNKKNKTQNHEISINTETRVWSFVSHSPKDKDGETFAHTIGLAESYNHPELMIFGLPKESAEVILSECAEKIQKGERFPTNKRIKNILSDHYEVSFSSIKKEHYPEYLSSITRHYGHENYDALVIFWPDRENRLPKECGHISRLQTEALKIT